MFIKLGDQTFNSEHIIKVWETTGGIQIETVHGPNAVNMRNLPKETFAALELMLEAKSPQEWNKARKDAGTPLLGEKVESQFDWDRLSEVIDAALRELGELTSGPVVAAASTKKKS